VGIWDTVSSVGWISTQVRLFSVARNPTVRIGRHAISIDERRCFYRDNLWEKATDEQLARVESEDDPHPMQDLLQVWFPGVHSDVGGSYSQHSSGLSNGALQWLIEQAEKAGADIKPHMKQLVLGEEVNPLPEEPDERKRVEVLRDLYLKPTKTFVHRSIKGPWWLLEVLPHRYYDKDDGEENWRTPLGMWRRLPSGKMSTPDGQDIEQTTFVHRTAKELMDRGTYMPPNVVGGSASLKPADVEGQPAGSLYVYEPPQDAKPIRNEAWVRWSVMIAVSAADLAVLGLVLKGAVVAVEALVRGMRWK
jgi:hypothetical protein